MTNVQPPVQTWAFDANMLNVVDGDTVDVELDIGFHTRRIERLRLLGVNTPELHATDPQVRTAAAAAKLFTVQWMHAHISPAAEWSFRVQTEKTDAFGRYLATVWAIDDGSCLNDELLAQGFAVVYTR